MKIFAGGCILTAVLMSPAALEQAWTQHQRNAKAEEAGRTLRAIYVLTPSNRLKIVSAYAWQGRLCISYYSQDARPESARIYNAIFERDRTFEYAAEDEFEQCEGAADGVNVLPATEHGAKGETE
jgi:hypothetical protein